MGDILVLGSGELGDAIINSLRQHPAFSSNQTITASIRPSTLANPSSSRATQISQYKANGTLLLAIDVESDSVDTLASHFTPFNTIIHAGGMTLAPGTQLKITEAVLASAAKSNSEKVYVPWQFGLDYDAIGPSTGEGLFAEQVRIRKLLRSQTQVKWVIVSNGIFTSFMFEPLWGVLQRGSGTKDPGSDGAIVVRALGAWEDKLVVTTAEDIARCTAELVLVDTDYRGEPVFIAGDSISYSDVADVVERVSGQRVDRELWSVETLKAKMEADPDDKLRQYHVVFSSGVGTNWPKHETYNERKGIKTTGVEEWLVQNHVLG